MDNNGYDPWRKSSYSGTNGGGCVEVAKTGRVLVRDTTNRAGGHIDVSAEAWQAFINKLK
jgi:hypothetical protein